MLKWQAQVMKPGLEADLNGGWNIPAELYMGDMMLKYWAQVTELTKIEV